MSPLSPDATCRVVPKRSHACHSKTCAPPQKCFFIYFHSQSRNGHPFFSRKLPQRGQRPGSFHGATRCLGLTGQASLNSCHTSGRTGKFRGWNEPLRKTAGGISGRNGRMNFPGAISFSGSRRRRRVGTSNNSRQSRQTTVCTSQWMPPSAPPESCARYWHHGHSKWNVLPTYLKYTGSPHIQAAIARPAMKPVVQAA